MMLTDSIRSALVWFYCLPFPVVALILLSGTIGFSCLKERFSARIWWKWLTGMFILIWIGMVCGITLGSRVSDEASSVLRLRPFHSYTSVHNGGSIELLRSNVMNVLLFYPGGILLNSVFSGRLERWKQLLLIVFFCMFLSIAIEFCQYRFDLGVTEIDDVIHNVLGALIGALLCGGKRG